MTRAVSFCLFWLAAGCNQFVNEPVACEPRALNYTLSGKPGRTGLCAFPEAIPFQMSHAPKLASAGDPSRPAQGRDHLSLVGGRVDVIGSEPTVLLCSGSPSGAADVCTAEEAAAAITTTIGSDGSLRYHGLYVLDMAFAAGSKLSRSDWPLVEEVYGPGNQCTVKINLDISCEEAQ